VARRDNALTLTLLVSFTVSLCYYLTAKIGFAFSLQPTSVSVLWLPNSILLAGLLLIPRRSWWILILAAFPAHFAVEFQSGVPTSMLLSWFISNSAQALIGATTITYLVRGAPRFDKFRHLTIFLLCGALLAPFLSSFLDIGFWGSGSNFEVWLVRFLANVVATLSIVPFILTWATDGFGAIRKAPAYRFVEAAVLSVSLIAVAMLVFKSEHFLAESTPTILTWPLPFLLWTSMRFGPRGTSTSLLVVMFFAIAGATRGEGPFVSNSAAMNAVSIQWFFIVVSVPLLYLAAVIEERGRVEEAARSNEERLTLALSAAQMGTWDWDIQNKKISRSASTRQIFGFELREDESEFDLDSFYSRIHPEDRDLVKLSLAKSLETGSPYEVEFRVVSRNTTVWLLGKGEVLYDQKGHPVRMLGVNIDITAKKQAEEALRESEARLQRSQEFSLVMVTHVGLDGRWLKVPQNLCDLLGYSEAELLAKKAQDITHRDDIEAELRNRQRLVRGDVKSFDFEKRYIHKDGHSVWVYLNSTVVEDDRGRPVHFLTYIRDITAKKIADQSFFEVNTRNQAILRALPDMMFLQTRDGVYVDFYARDQDMLLLPPESFLGKNLNDVLPPDLAKKVMSCMARLDDRDEIQILNYSLELFGGRRDYEARIVAAEGDKALSIVRDVTEARRATEAARISEEKLLLSNEQIRRLASQLMTAQESERRRISLLLHDDVGQNVAALGLSLSRLKRKLANVPEVGTDVEYLFAQTKTLTTQIRRLSHQLHPEALEHLGLVAALESHVADYCQVEHVDVEFKAEVGSEPIPFEVSLCLYRVALEALRNIARHSGAKRGSLLLKEEHNSIILEVADSGHGFDIEKARHGSGIWTVKYGRKSEASWRQCRDSL
jgi:PAS domain S-box-containing protein